MSAEQTITRIALTNIVFESVHDHLCSKETCLVPDYYSWQGLICLIDLISENNEEFNYNQAADILSELNNTLNFAWFCDYELFATMPKKLSEAFERQVDN